MNITNSSRFIDFIKTLNIGDTSVAEAEKTSCIVNTIQSIIEKVQQVTEKLVKDSKITSSLDYIILGVISMLFVAVTVAPTSILGLLSVVAFSLMILKILFVKGEKPASSAFNVPIFLYIAIAGISVAFSSLLFPSIKGYLKMIIYFCSYFTFLNILKDKPKRIFYVLGLLAVTVSLEAFYAIYQNFTGIEELASWQDTSNANPEQLVNRVYGTLKPFNPNLLAGYLVAGFSSILGTACLCLTKKKFRLAVLSTVSTLAVLIAIVFTGSRGAYIAVSAMLALFLLFSWYVIWHDLKHIKWLKKLWVVVVVTGIVGILLFILTSPAIQHRIISIFAFRDDSSNSYRFNVYASGFKMFLDNWLIGIGPGNTTFRLMYGLYMITGFDALGTYCVPLEMAVESGIFGLLSFLWLLVMCYARSIKNIINNISMEIKIITIACIVAITGMMVHGFVDTVWYRPQVQLIFWMIIAILAIITSGRFVGSEKK